ncbi:MAG: winged helix-turn-helix domain-containing protein [Spirulinaceae cyanobacterium SM2_1_0]|nr:winged helix-turn-helix domain-containing protein [Spirulinaceae cyanobacterium SM2_1_0]
MQTHNEATLNELRELVAEKLKVNVSRSTIDRMLKKLGFSRKKQASTQPRKPVSPSSNNGSSTGKPLA